MQVSRDAETVRNLADVAVGRCIDEESLSLLLRRAKRLAERLEGKPRDSDALAIRRLRANNGKGVAAVALAAVLLISPVAHARGNSEERTCAQLREEHPGFGGAFDVTAHKAAWNGHGFDDEPKKFVCPAVDHSTEPTMKIEKVPSHHRNGG